MRSYLPPGILSFVEFVGREKNPGLAPTALEAVRHLPVIKDGPLFSVREHIRANAMGRSVVIKVLKKPLSSQTTTGVTGEELERVMREIKILSSKPVIMHNNLIELESIEFGIHSGEPFEICPALVLEKAPHGSLDDFLEKNKTLSWQTKKSLCRDIASGLQCLHLHGVFHEDIQASHVLIFDHPEHQYMAKLTGFGDCKILTGKTSADLFNFGGTKPFRAPEMEEGSTTFDHCLKADIFSAGLLFWSIFLNQGFFRSFDLPLDQTFCNNDIIDILQLPYLFRFIPLLIEHEIGMVQEQEFSMLQKLFACTVRLSPRQRNLDQALTLLSSGDEETMVSREPEDISIESVDSSFDEIKVSTDVLKGLPHLVAKQYLEALETLYEVTDCSSVLGISGTWNEFICHFYGYGTEQSPQKAAGILGRCMNETGELADLANLLVTVLRAALAIVPETQEPGCVPVLAEVDAGWDGKIGPWIKLGRSPLAEPELHGLTLGLSEAMLLWFKIQEGDHTMAIDCGSSNTLIHGFVLYGQLEQVKHLVELGFDVNAVNDGGESALVLSCRYGYHEIAMLLLDHGADASIRTKTGESGLHWLCSTPSDYRNHLALELVKKGAQLLDYTKIDDEWAPICPGLKFLRDGRMIGEPLLRAVANRDIATVQLLLLLIGVVISTIDSRVQLVLLVTHVLERPLRLACELHLYDIIQVLCEEFKQIVTKLEPAGIPSELQNLVDSLGTDSGAIGPMFMTITNSNAPSRVAIDMSFQVHRLCYHKADWRAACRRTQAVLLTYGFATSILKTERGPYTTLAYTVRCGNDEALRFFLGIEALKKSIDTADNRGYTLVHHAIESRQRNSLLTLGDSGATFDLRSAKDPNHCLSGVEASYLHVLGSVRCDDPAFIKLFLDHNVPATIRDNRGLSALSLALKRGAFTLAEILIENGASILEEGIFGVNFLGELFIPDQANQYDDLFATFKFLLSYQDRGIPMFITRQQHKYTVFHTAAAYPREEELYLRMVNMIFQNFGERELLEAQADTPAKSTALQIAISMYNPIVVKTLLGAGVNLHDKDVAGRTPLGYAMELLYKLVHERSQREDKERTHTLDQISEIILLLSEKSGWPDAIEQFPKLMDAFEEAEPLIKKMACSEHRVANMRHLEKIILSIIGEGYAPMLSTMSLHHLDLVRRISMKRLQPALTMDLEYRVLPHKNFTSPTSSFDGVKAKVPWCNSLSNNLLQDYQIAAAFEWLLDLIQRDALPEGQLKDMAEVLREYAFSGRRSDLHLNPDIVRYPFTLLKWYEKSISEDAFVLSEIDMAKIQSFMQLLRDRREGRIRKDFPLPPFDEEFARLHFDHLHPEKLDPEKAVASVLLVTRCHCFFDRIGLFSRFKITRMCQKMTSIDDEMFSQRLKKSRVDLAKNIDGLCIWKTEIGLPAHRTYPLSTMKWMLVDEELNHKYSLLAHPEDLEPELEDASQNQLPQQVLNFPITISKKWALPYEPLDFDRNEIRLLTVLPTSGKQDEIVCCKMEHFSVLPAEYTDKYCKYVASCNKKETSPSDYHRRWSEKNQANRFIWGDFSCLSYTWGEPSDTRTIMINGLEVIVRSNLEAALKSFRQQKEFQRGLMLWIDALCINQADMDEKEKTIRDMQNIYLGAHTVTIWLGAGSSKSDEALHTIHNFIARYSKPTEDSTDVGHVELLDPPPLWFSSIVYPAIVQLMDRPYWRRLWIMQEITACAPCEKIYIGNYHMTWTELVLLLKSCMCSRDSVEFNDEYTETLNNRVLACIHQAYILTTMAETYRRVPGLGKLNTSVEYGRASSWLDLGRTSQVTDERDRVYGILGLIPEQISSRIVPSYTNTLAQVYRDLSRALIDSSGCFDECFVGSINTNPGLTSWAVDMRDTSGSWPKNGRAGGFHNPYDDFLKTGQLCRITVKKQATAEDSNPDETDDSAHYSFSEDGSVLTIVAIHVDTVEGISGSIVKYTSPIAVINANWKPSTQLLTPREGVTARETILRVMTADAAFEDEPHNSIFDIPYFTELEPEAKLVEQLHNNGWSSILRSQQFRIFHKYRLRKATFPLFEGKKLEDWFTRDVTPCNEEAIAKALTNVRMISERTFITTERGTLGSTGLGVQEGDCIFVAFGCSYPFLARPDGDGYRIVGECYLDGFMDGEALDMVANNELEIGKIELR